MIHSHFHAEKSGIAMCVGCGSQIHDQYIMRVSPDLEWHAACLKCAECSQYLDETCTCFVRDGKTYCKRDYARWEIEYYCRRVSERKDTKERQINDANVFTINAPQSSQFQKSNLNLSQHFSPPRTEHEPNRSCVQV